MLLEEPQDHAKGSRGVCITQRAGDVYLQGTVMGLSHDQESLLLVTLDLSMAVTHT